MGWVKIKKEWSVVLDAYMEKFLCDKDEDVLNLPVACPGSTAIVADRGNEYIANTEGIWVFKSGDESRAVEYVIPATDIKGVWKFNDFDGYDETLIPEPMEYYLRFTDNNGDEYQGLSYEFGDGIVIRYNYMDSWEDSYATGNGWFSEYYSTILIDSTISEVENGDKLLAWLNTIATKIA